MTGSGASGPRDLMAALRASLDLEAERRDVCPAREGDALCGTPRPCPVHMPHQWAAQQDASGEVRP